MDDVSNHPRPYHYCQAGLQPLLQCQLLLHLLPRPLHPHACNLHQGKDHNDGGLEGKLKLNLRTKYLNYKLAFVQQDPEKGKQLCYYI